MIHLSWYLFAELAAESPLGVMEDERVDVSAVRRLLRLLHALLQSSHFSWLQPVCLVAVVL